MFLRGLDPSFKVTWFKHWTAACDDALAELPRLPLCPPGLYRQLCESTGTADKRIALVHRKDSPQALIGLRQNGHQWDPVLTWILPGPSFAARPEALYPALRALQLNVQVIGWHWAELCRLMGTKKPFVQSAHQVPCSADHEAYWRQTGQFSFVRRIRNKTRHLQLEINGPGAAEWTIRHWAAHWQVHPDREIPTLHDRLLVARALEGQGRHYTFRLIDNGRPVVGDTLINDQGDLIWQVTYRDPAYRALGVGTRLIDLIFQWAAQARFKTIDMGSSQEYKLRWVPHGGVEYVYQLCPAPLRWASGAKAALDRLHRAGGALRRKLDAISHYGERSKSPREARIYLKEDL